MKAYNPPIIQSLQSKPNKSSARIRRVSAPATLAPNLKSLSNVRIQIPFTGNDESFGSGKDSGISSDPSSFSNNDGDSQQCVYNFPNKVLTKDGLGHYHSVNTYGNKLHRSADDIRIRKDSKVPVSQITPYKELKISTICRHYYPEGAWGWTVVLMASLIEIINGGIMFSVGKILPKIQETFHCTEEETGNFPYTTSDQSSMTDFCS